MPSRITDILALLAASDDGDRSLYDIFADIFTGLDHRLAGVEGVSASLADLQAQLAASGSEIVEQALGPVVAAIAAKADLGALLTASSVSTLTVETGLASLIITPAAARAAFAPAHILSIVATDEPGVAMYARRVSYDTDSGELLVDVLSTMGTGTISSWTIAPASLAAMASALTIDAVDGIEGPTLQQALTQIATALAARQPLADSLSALAAATLQADRLLGTGADGAVTQRPISAFGTALLALTTDVAVRAALGAAPLASPALTGKPTAPTASVTADSQQIANITAVRAAVANLVSAAPASLDTLKELATALGNDANFAATVTNALALKAPLASPAFTGAPTGPTPAAKDNDTSLATTAFVQGEKGYTAGVTTLTASTTLTSAHLGDLVVCNAAGATTMTLPAAASYSQGVLSLVNINTGLVTLSGSIIYDGATVTSTTLPAGVSIELVSNGTSWVIVQRTLPDKTTAEWTTGTDTVTAPISPAQLAATIADGLTRELTFTVSPRAPTPATADSSTKLATTAFVQAAIAALVASSPSALDTLNELAAALGDDPNFATTITNALALKAPLASPAFTGAPTAPTPGTADNSTSLATTAWGQANKAYAKSRLLLVSNAYTMDAAYLGRLVYFNRTAAGDVAVTLLDPTAYDLGILSLVNLSPTATVNLTTPAGSILYARTASASFALAPGNFVELISNKTDWIVTRTGLAPLNTADWLAGVSTVEAPISPAKLAAALGPGISKTYESAETAIVAGGGTDVTHGLGRVPKLVQICLICKTAELGFSVGDVVTPQQFEAGYGFVVKATATKVSWQFSSSLPRLFFGAQTSSAAITAANWRVIARAFA